MITSATSLGIWKLVKADKSMRIVCLIFLLIGLTSCFPHGGQDETVRRSVAEDEREGRAYLDALINLIQKTDQIIVTEHSNEFDAFDAENGKSLIPGEVIYKTVNLNLQQKDSFLSKIRNLPPKTQDVFSACDFEPHHTVRFYTAGKLTSTMEICFVCGDVQWDTAPSTPPFSLLSGLGDFISGIGLSPERDWAALAKKQLK